jgi:WD40 repeat protein
MFTWLKSILTFNTTEPEVVTRFVAKSTGQRGPLIALIPTRHKNEAICLCVTPSSIFVFFWEATPLGKRLSPEDDAFTCAVAFRDSAVLVGTQKGQVCRVHLDDLLVFKSRSFSHPSSGATTAIAADGDRFAAGFADGSIAFWASIEASPEIFRSSVISVTCLVFVASTNALWSGNADGNLTVFYLDPLGNFSKIPGVAKMPMTLRWHKTLNVVLVIDAAKELVVVAISDHSVLHRYDAALVTCGEALTCLEILGNEKFLLLGAADGSFCVRTLSLSDKAPGKLRCHLLRVWEVAIVAEAAPATCAAWDTESDTLLVGDAGCRVRSVADFEKKVSDIHIQS